MAAWLIIAGVLLLGPTSAPAEPYIRVYKKGVIYYYFTKRESPPARQAGRQFPAPASVRPPSVIQPTLPVEEALVQEAPHHYNLPPALVNAVNRQEANFHPEAAAFEGAQDLRQLRSGPADNWQVVKPYEGKEIIWAGTRSLSSFLAKLGYLLPPALAASGAGPWMAERRPEVPPLQETQAFIREVCDNFRQYAQERYPELAQMARRSDSFRASTSPRYSFPVAGPFSFRDTWGEWRSGGRSHHAVDIFASEGTAVYAITDGVIHQLTTWQGAGLTLLLRGQDGLGYGYMHLQGYAPGIMEGKVVRNGELIAYVGRTGLQQSPAHLHFQVYVDHHFCNGQFVNPYAFLVQLCHGIGVTDLLQQRVARLHLPAVEIENLGTVRLSDSVARQSMHPRGPVDIFHQ